MQAGCFACCFKVRYFNFLPSSVWRRAWGGHVIPGSLGANLSMPAGGPTALLGHLWTMMGAKARLSPGMMSIHRVRGNIPSSLHANRSTHLLFLGWFAFPRAPLMRRNDLATLILTFSRCLWPSCTQELALWKSPGRRRHGTAFVKHLKRFFSQAQYHF